MKLLATLAAAGLAALGTTVALAVAGDDPQRAAVSTASTTAVGSTVTASTTAETTTQRTTTTRDAGEDVRGPCDEAEHRNDPRCSAASAGDDRGGRSGKGGRNRRGSNRGRG